MNRIRFVFRSFKWAFILIFLSGLTSNVYAKDKDCWVDFYESPQYEGEHFRLQGPSELKNLDHVNGKSWDRRISSLIVGPNARVTLFENIDFKLTLREMANYPVLMKSLGVTKQDVLEESELIFDANSKIHTLADFNFHDRVRSLKVKCNK
ncbi:beta/gamma crystallin domain-containing protein [Methylomarinum sp. Ch1-1]|uniref:Beta/gamma crystallin domain-containing protein n=1 Tax=Methylomarinum roseum TaxID=3067653 RepID=A0AAU7NYD9_9GAMM|nr:beta/gamma crystallin domain-containing protein [Methylomarinum sp. Ch1-1]MDP4521886.1 beta/gamma crystallin domain-containing protein [Methylomarinum sp. Ch1-1]